MSPKRWLISLFMLATACFLMACSGSSSSPEAAAKAFMEAAYTGKADTVLKMVHIPGNAKPGEAEMVEGKLRAMVAESKAKADERFGGYKSVEVVSTEINPNDADQAHVRLRVIFKNNEKTENVRTIKVDGKWKIRL